MAEKLTIAESREIAEQLLTYLDHKQMDEFWQLLDERVLQRKVMEKYLQALTKILAGRSDRDPDSWLLLCNTIAARKTDSAYCLAALIMRRLVPHRMKECLDLSRNHLSDTERWFSSDVYAVHVVCEALRHDFSQAVKHLSAFVNDSSVWARRCVGIAVYHYVQQVNDAPENISILLDVAKNLIGDKDVRVAKGVGWGLRSIGKTYPDKLIRFARENFARKKVSKLLFRVAVAELPLDAKEELLLRWLSS